MLVRNAERIMVHPTRDWSTSLSLFFRRLVMKRFENKVAVVTGGNSGIGLATAKRLHEEGARVAIVGRNAQTLEEATRTIGDGVLAVQADVAKLSEIVLIAAKNSPKVPEQALTAIGQYPGAPPAFSHQKRWQRGMYQWHVVNNAPTALQGPRGLYCTPS
jgi:NAD(P)-dependent dehydrogenase (short-subunit alcohol dehydrogenase family)